MTQTLELNGGLATYTRNDHGEWDLVSWKAPERTRFTYFRNMARALRSKGYILEKTSWADGWKIKAQGDYWTRWTLYLSPDNKWSIYDSIPDILRGEDIADERRVKTQCDQHEILTYLLFFA